MARHRYLVALATAVLLAAGLVVVPAGAAEDCEWLAGDLHVHTTYSHDAYGGPSDDNTGPDEAYTLGHTVTSQFAMAASRGLDFTAITDHNDIRSQADAGFGAFGVIAVAGYENSLNGHAQMLGAEKIYDNGDRSASAVQGLADLLRADGGSFQINHPVDSPKYPAEMDWGYGYAVVPDTVEVWNISRLWQPPMPSGSANEDSVRYWQGFLDAGHRVAATGGSDNHYVSTSAIQGVGQPTTWVCAASSDEAGVLAGLRAGHTYISHQPPTLGGPRLFIEGDSDGDGTFEAIAGDAVAPDASLRVRVEGAPGSLLRLVTNGGRSLGDPIPVTSPDFTFTRPLPEGSTWIRAEVYEPDASAQRAAICDDMLGDETTYCRDPLLVLAMTSPVYVRAPGPMDTSLVNTGATGGRVGSTTTFAATLSASGSPIAGAPVTFTFRGVEHRAVTDDTGVARVGVLLTGPPGTYDLAARYDGDARYLPSSYSIPFEITKR